MAESQDDKFETKLTDEERKEFMRLVKDAASGRLSKKEAEQAAEYVAEYLRKKGITPESF